MPAWRAAIIVVLFHHVSAAQFLPSLQANDPAEFDAYLLVLHARDPGTVATAAARFEREWPKSELLAHVYELTFEACRARGDAACAIKDGRRALTAAPANVPVAFRLAEILATKNDLGEATEIVQRAEQALKSFKPPRTVPFPDWQTRLSHLRARAAATRALIAFKKGKVPEAVKLYEEAIQNRAEPADHLRLARLYRLTGRLREAEAQFKIAAQDPSLAPIVKTEFP